MTAASKNTRKKIRFSPDPAEHAQIDFHVDRSEFTCELPALIRNESYSGCCIVAYQHEKFKVGQQFKIKVGPLAPLRGEIRWVDQLDSEFMKVGIEFLE